jgi:hypothetical protein
MNTIYGSYANGNLEQLPPLPQKLLKLYCHNNLLIQLPLLPPFLKILSCERNPMSQLPQLPPSLEMIWVSPWQIESCLNNLNNTNDLCIVIIN